MDPHPGEQGQPAPTGEHRGPDDSRINENQNQVETAHEANPNSNQSVVLCEVHLSKDDVRDWSKRDAFRHFYVNWREGMREVSNLPKKPKLEYTETDGFINILAPRTGCPFEDPRPWGFIQLNKENGTVVLNITDGLILRGYLEHSSSEREHEHRHRPASPSNKLLKAVMVMMNAGYQVRFGSSKDRWDFFNGNSFSFSRTPSSEDAFLASLNKPSNVSSPAAKVMARDLTIAIGPGDDVGCKVSREKVLQWLGVTLDIGNFLQPCRVIKTEHGDLLLDSGFANKVYVNGILLSTSHIGTFRYGYHLHHEEIVTEELALIPCEKEAYLRCRIWDAALEKDHTYTVLPLLLRLIRDYPRAADARRVEVYLRSPTIVKLWKAVVVHIGSEMVYCQESDYLAQVRQHTKRSPIVIPSFLWSVFRRPFLIRTWAEELLFTAPRSMAPDTRFAAIVNRALKALLLQDAHTANGFIVLVDHPLVAPTVHCDPKAGLFVLSKLWMDYAAVHKIYPCRRSASGDKTLLDSPRDHLIISLYEQVLKVASRTLPNPQDGPFWIVRMRQLGVERIEEMPRAVATKQSMQPRELCVVWQQAVPAHVAGLINTGYHVVLHHENCTRCLGHVVHGEVANRDSETAPCGCPQKLVPQKQSIVLFSQLDPLQKYIPMVAVNTKDSIYGAPPPALQPKANVGECMTISAMVNPDGVSQQTMQKFWETWQKVTYPVVFGLFTPRYGSPLPNRRPVAAMGHERLHYHFERHQHIVVKVKAAVHPGPNEMRHYVLYVHGIYPPESPGEQEGYLLATMYSFLRSTSFCLFQVGLSTDKKVSLRELLLHFRDFDAMGSRQDAIVLPIRDVEWTESVDPLSLGQFEDVHYTVDPPPDVSRTGYFCRFAVRAGGPVDSACLMPVASQLLPHAKRWPEPRYCFNPRPSVIDLSPGYLGLAEGFRQAGSSIDAAFGFGPARDHTWKARYPSAKAYDGILSFVLGDLTAKKLNRPPQGPKGTSRIILLSIPDLDGEKTWDQILGDFKIAHIIPRLLVAFPEKPDFWVFTMPPWVFLERAFLEFFKAMYTLLLNRYAVHLKNVSFPSLGVPVDGAALVMVASCVPSPMPWEKIFPVMAANTTNPVKNVTVASRIQDLNFFNTRPSPLPNYGGLVGRTLVCRHPTTNADTYNHETGWMGLSNNPRPASLNLNAPLALTKLRAGVKHFKRGDILTVREIARVQGFPDDFVFLGVYLKQYNDVLSGFPPPVARKVAECIALMVREYSSFYPGDDGHGDGGDGGGGEGDQRGLKRLRQI